jgi:cupin 2 domain-containing protein
MQNIYNFSPELYQAAKLQEQFEAIASNDNLLIERIISTGQTTPDGQWYDQYRDEWVILLQGEAEISYEDNSRMQMRSGDYLLIPAHKKHRVEYTSSEPPCIWLAVHSQSFSP